VFGFCGFLSFSLVFCLLGGRLGTTLYIHSTRRWVKSRRHSSALRESEDEKKRRKKYAILRSAERRAWGAYVEFINRPVRLTDSVLPTTGPAPSGGGRIPPFRRYVSVPGAAYDLHYAYLGESAPRKVECESGQADALCLHKCAATASASLSMRGVRPVGVCVGLDAGLYRWRWL
jgi:hypothetical protein